MIKYVFATALLFFTSVQAFATDLTPGNLVGRYNVQAKAGFQTVYIKFRVVDTHEFELQRTYPDGHSDETCNGNYNLNNGFYLDELGILASGHTFKGVFTCPGDRTKRIDFNINFGRTTVEDLVKGTSVSVTSSMAPGMTLSAYVKKQ